MIAKKLEASGVRFQRMNMGSLAEAKSIIPSCI